MPTPICTDPDHLEHNGEICLCVYCSVSCDPCSDCKGPIDDCDLCDFPDNYFREMMDAMFGEEDGKEEVSV